MAKPLSEVVVNDSGAVSDEAVLHPISKRSSGNITYVAFIFDILKCNKFTANAFKEIDLKS